MGFKSWVENRSEEDININIFLGTNIKFGKPLFEFFKPGSAGISVNLRPFFISIVY